MLSTSFQSNEDIHGHTGYYSIMARGQMLDRVYSMRYRSYSAKNYIEENSSGKFIDEYDGVKHNPCFLAYHENKAIGAIRACVFDPALGMPIPAMEVFDDEIKNSIGYDKVFVEGNKFVIDPSFQRKGGIQARLLLVGTVVEEAVRRNAYYILVAVRPAHVKFYEMLGAKAVSDAKSYPHLSFKTVLMVCSDIEHLRNFIKSKINVVEKRNGPAFNYENY